MIAVMLCLVPLPMALHVCLCTVLQVWYPFSTFLSIRHGFDSRGRAGGQAHQCLDGQGCLVFPISSLSCLVLVLLYSTRVKEAVSGFTASSFDDLVRPGTFLFATGRLRVTPGSMVGAVFLVPTNFVDF